MTDQKIMNVAMVGVGNFGAARRQLMRETGLFRIVSAYDLNEKALNDAQKQDGAQPVSSYDALLATPDIEAVVISTGARFHAEQVLAALERGLHVFVEKPLCATPAESDSLLAAQQQSGRVVGVGHHDCTNDPWLQHIRGMIEAGELGDLVCFERTTAHGGGFAIKDGDWRGDPDKNPGGMLFQCGVHAIHDLLYLFGPIAKVSCLLRDNVHTTRTADAAHCLLTSTCGLTGTLNAYHITPYRHTFSIFGTKGALYKSDRYFDEGTSLIFQPRISHGKEEEIPIHVDSTTTMKNSTGALRSFHQAVRTGSACYPSLIDGARAVGVVFAAEESARQRREIELPASLYSEPAPR